tara:strand:- start:40 stop:267 length:228 start_codon:yes stop_codon:yes gene_type:complete
VVAGCASFPLSLGQLPLYFFKELDMEDEEKLYTFSFTEEEMGIIMHCLGEAPARMTNGLINRINEEGAKMKEEND